MASRSTEPPSVHVSRAWRRRQFLVLLGLSLTSAGLAACGGDGGGDGGGAAIDTQQLPTPYSFPGTSDKDSVHDSCIPGTSRLLGPVAESPVDTNNGPFVALSGNVAVAPKHMRERPFPVTRAAVIGLGRVASTWDEERHKYDGWPLPHAHIGCMAEVPEIEDRWSV